MSQPSALVPSMDPLTTTTPPPQRAEETRPASVAPPSAISMRGFNSWYGTNQVLHALDLEIAPRQVCGFIGPSGCGKSTLLRWINRMNDTIPGARAEGTLSLHGIDLLLKPRIEIAEGGATEAGRVSSARCGGGVVWSSPG